MQTKSSIRLGLCCIFLDQPIKFRTTTIKSLSSMNRDDALLKLSEICLNNAQALYKSLKFCAANNIGCFRINSQILPIKTHSKFGYDIYDIPDGENIVRLFKECRQYSKDQGIRTSLHPDQFVVMNSPNPDVVNRSIAELEYQAQVADWVGADVVNIHGGGGYGDKPEALSRFARNLNRLSAQVRKRLTLENDDTTYTPSDLLALCQTENIPLVYDIHHHRCNQDNMTGQEATTKAIETWDREPMFHISSPRQGWSGPKPRQHHDYIDLKDFPEYWLNLKLTVEVEAKAKEVAVLKLQNQISTCFQS
ncbi:MAG: UV DNA damage repair endonuclease UvsE [Verrucomicrobiota bacterium]|nr:UV DNA damage repair endonuclease UvsE [Verrucomicrobiota bacterium]